MERKTIKILESKGYKCIQYEGNSFLFITPNSTVIKFLNRTDKSKRFARELDICSLLKLSHFDGIAEVLKVSQNEKNEFDEDYIEFKKYDGDLRKFYSICKGDAKKTLSMLLPIISSLSKLSKLTPHIYHRDIKPENILYDVANDRLILTDFGICFINDDSDRITKTSEAVGPWNFSAPECLTGRDNQITEKSDIYSIGKMIWYLIDGQKRIFPNDYYYKEEYDLVNSFSDAEMNGINMIIDSCLKYEPAERPSYDVLIQNINNFLDPKLHVAQLQRYKIIDYENKMQKIDEEKFRTNLEFIQLSLKYILESVEILWNLCKESKLIDSLYKNIKWAVDNLKIHYSELMQGRMFYIVHFQYKKINFKIHFVSGQQTPDGKISLEYVCRGKSKWLCINHKSNGSIEVEQFQRKDTLSKKPILDYFDNLINDYINEKSV